VSKLSYRSGSVARCFIFAVSVSIALAACSGPAAEREPSLEFIEVVTGDADPQTPLPLFVGIHGFGGAPESFSQFFVEHVTFPARFAFARGPVAQGTGFSWFPISWKTGADDFAEKFQESTEQVAQLGRWLARNRPTVGEPVVFGFSQGGMLSFAIAGSKDPGFRAAVPISGFLPRELWPEEIDDAISVRAYHGSADTMISAADARATAEHFQSLGVPVEVIVYEGVGHSISRQMGEDILASLRMLGANPSGTGLPSVATER